MYNTNFTASNPVQTSDEYSFEGTNNMQHKRSSFSVSTLIGAVVFGVLALGVIAANIGSQQNQDITSQATESQVYGENTQEAQAPFVNNEQEGQVAGVQIAQIKEGDGNSLEGGQCGPYCTASCNSPTSCSSSCNNVPPTVGCTQGFNVFMCTGNHASCNGANGTEINASSPSVDPTNPANWCKTFQVDVWVRDGNGTYDPTNAVVVHIGDNGQVCSSNQSCNPANLDWDCTRPTPTPTPTPTTQCPGKPEATCVTNSNGTAKINVKWNLNGAPTSTAYVVRGDHMWGTNNQCRNANQTLVGWYCPSGVASCDPLNLGYRCDDRIKNVTGSTTTFDNIERGKLYKVAVQVGPSGCTSLSTDVTCPLPPTTPTPPTTPSPTPTPVVLTCNSVCNYGPGVRDLCTVANPTWICYPGEQYPGQTSGQGNCRLATNTDGNPESLVCKDRAGATPTPMGPMCLGIARTVTESIPNDPNPNAPDVGERVKFTCEQIQGWNVTYEFQWMRPDGVIEKLDQFENVGNETLPYLVTMPGQYHAQCRVCVQGAQTCQPFEPFPGNLGDVKGASAEESATLPGDPASFDSINEYMPQ